MEEYISLLIGSDLMRAILRLIVIAVLTIIALRLVTLAADLGEKRFIASIDDPDRQSRLRTLLKTIKATARVVVLVLAVLIGLSTIGVDVRPALAAAGIFGLAISLGAQTLIKDVIAGLTILLEDEYRVGEEIIIGSVRGEVHRITLRRTDVRDVEGRLVIVPNGEVRVVSNETREWARALVEINLGFDTDINKAIKKLSESLDRLDADARIQPYLLEKPEIFGWNSLSDWSVVVRLRVKVRAGNQGEVARVMRQYALEALQDAGIPVESSSRINLVPGADGPARSGSGEVSPPPGSGLP